MINYKLQRIEEEHLWELSVDGFFVMLLRDDGTFQRLRYARAEGVKVDDEGRIREVESGPKF